MIYWNGVILLAKYIGANSIGNG